MASATRQRNAADMKKDCKNRDFYFVFESLLGRTAMVVRPAGRN
jgi:hypothetical protein